jgi:hypothetical protein
MARWIASSCRRLAAATMKRELSGLAVAVVLERLEGGDDVVKALLAPAMVGSKSLAAAGLGLGDEDAVVVGLLAVDGQELDGGLEIGTH